MMIHELREYVAVPGRAEDLHRRFADMTLHLFREVGLDVEGFWHVTGDRQRIVYLTRFGTVGEAQEHWRASPQTRAGSRSRRVRSRTVR